MIRIGKVTVKGDDRVNRCIYRALLENGRAVLSMWELINITPDCDGGPTYSTYRRVA